MGQPAISIISMEQRMSLFRDAVKFSSDCPLDKDRVEYVLETFNKFLDGVVRGLPVPIEVGSVGILDEFIADRCELDDSARVQAKHIYDEFCLWVGRKYPQNTCPTIVKFGDEMRKRFAKKHSNKVYFLGIGLK